MSYVEPRVITVVGSAISSRELELLKAGEAEVKPRFAQLANFEREHLEIPAGVERQLVVGEGTRSRAAMHELCALNEAMP